MESHPVPQNVTAFEFRLVGDMTLKQFGYLASGLIIAYLCFVFLLPSAPTLALPIIIFSSLTGTAFAFMPILDRPLDHWFKAYLKAIFSPTQAAWKYKNADLSADTKDPIFANRFTLYLSRLTPAQNPPLLIQTPPQPERPILRPLALGNLTSSPANIKSTPPTPTIQSPPPPKPPKKAALEIPSAEELEKIVEMAKQSQAMQLKIIQLEKELAWFKGKQTPLPSPASPPSPTKAPVEKQAKVKVVLPQTPQKTQLSLTSLPNVINGIVTDTFGSYLDSTIVIIHNKDNLPVRALKTNKLGQFTGATPLPDGVYTVSLEKDNLEFDSLQIILDGKVLPPLLISSKKKEVLNN